ncbi:triple tyrosine motif-containing protein [Sphingobacterium suaedae]|uniref:Triple tyrosine motif-containing protein n=1 Tax=Sphingobacterium suaedae TaxID=1686402 RepID=A0ABW5KI77_9SPHI
MIKYIHLCLLSVFLLLHYAAIGQNPLGIPLVQNYNKMHFQGGSRTWDIKQDSRGIMYFANNEGLFSFNGKYWKKYVLPNHTVVRSIFIDDHDRIYVGGQGEFGYFEASAEPRLKYVSLKSLLPADQQNFADIWHTVGFGRSVMFQATTMIFEFRDDQVRSHAAKRVWDFLGGAGGRLFAQDQANGLLEYKDGHWTSLADNRHFDGAKIASLVEMGRDSLLFTTLTNRSFLLHGNKITKLYMDGWTDLYTPSLAKIDDTEYVVATATEGCVVRDQQGKVVRRIGVVEGLQNKNVSVVFVDRDKNIWAGVDNAISVINYGSAVRYFRPNATHDVTGYSVRVFNNELYLSSSNGVYVTPLQPNYLDHSLSPGQFTLVSGSDRGEAWRLEELNGELLLGHNRGLFRIVDHTVTPIAEGTGSWLVLPLASVYPITQTLVGTYGGINLLHYAPGRFWQVRTLTGLQDSYRFLELDGEQIWASHPYRGIYQLHLNADRTAYQARLFTEEDGLPSSYQNYVFKIKGRIVFATTNGLYEFDPEGKRFVPSRRFSVFKGMSIKFLRDDTEGNIWFCSGSRIGVASYKTDRGVYALTYFPEIEGLNTSGFENIYPFNTQNVYIGSEKGVIHVNYQKYRNRTVKPAVLLTSVVATAKKDSIIFDGYSPLKTDTVSALFDPEVNELDANFDSFVFTFAGPSYGIHGQLDYCYWLEGYDTDWSVWTSNTEKAYTNLPSGTYTFKVKSRNNLLEESPVETFTFVIRPPWYKTVWALLGYLLLILAMIYFVFRWQQQAWQAKQEEFDKEMKQLRYIHQLEIEKNEKEIMKLQNEKLESEVQSKTKELANASMQLMENSGALSKLRIELTKLDIGDRDSDDVKRITSLLKDVEKNTTHWDQFASHFDELNDGFLHRLKLKHPALSRNDLKVCAYLRLNFTTKQIAQLQSISVRGVEIHRYRIRKKLAIKTEMSTHDYLLTV